MSKLKNKAVLFNNFDRSVQWYAVAVQAGRRFSVDPFLLMAMIDQESGGDPEAIGSAGEIGIMQMKQGALTDVINIQGLPFKTLSDMADPETGILYGAAYYDLQRSPNRVGGNQFDSLRAYNQGFAGMNRTDKNQLEKGRRYAKSVITKKQVLKNEFGIY